MRKLNLFQNPFASKVSFSNDKEFASLLEPSCSSSTSENELRLNKARMEDDPLSTLLKMDPESPKLRQINKEWFPKRIKDTKDGLMNKLAQILRAVEEAKNVVVFHEENNEPFTSEFFPTEKKSPYFEDHIRVVFRKKKGEDYLACEMTTKKKVMKKDGLGIQHVLLSRLVKEGLVKTVVTSNTRKSLFACPQENIVFVYGEDSTFACADCEDSMQVQQGSQVPKCVKCEKEMKSTIVSEGEIVPKRTIKRVRGIVEDADVVILLDPRFVEKPFTDMPWQWGTRGKTIHIIGTCEIPKDIKRVFLEGGIGSLRNIHAYTFSEDFLLQWANNYKLI